MIIVDNIDNLNKTAQNQNYTTGDHITKNLLLEAHAF